MTISLTKLSQTSAFAQSGFLSEPHSSSQSIVDAAHCPNCKQAMRLQSLPVRMTWARLLKRVFDIGIERCACGGKLMLIAVIEEPAVIEQILTHLGVSPQPPPRASARPRALIFDWA